MNVEPINTQLDPEVEKYWQNDAEKEVKFWRTEIAKDYRKLLDVPQKFLDNHPSLNEYKITILDSLAPGFYSPGFYSSGWFRKNRAEYEFEKLFISACKIRRCNNQDFLRNATLKYKTFQFLYDIIDYSLRDDKEFIRSLIHLDKGTHIKAHLRSVLHFIKDRLDMDSDLYVDFVNICPSLANDILYININNIKDITIINELCMSKILEITYKKDPKIAKEFLYFNSLAINVLAKDTLNYTEFARSFFNKIISINSAVYVHFPWGYYIKNDPIPTNDEVYFPWNDYVKDKYRPLFLELKNSINDLFFKMTDNECNNLIREAKEYDSELLKELVPLVTQKNSYSKCSTITDTHFQF